MIYMYNDFVKKGISDYKIKKLVSDKKLFMIKKGVYSTSEDYSHLEYISKKHPNAVFTLETACHCYGLTKKDSYPYVIATKQKDRKIKDEKIKQIFMTNSLYETGISKITYQGYNILIYDLERLLIDVVRNKVNIEYNLYHEIINSYKKISKLLNKNKLNDYIVKFKDPRIIERIKTEIFK